MTEAEVADFYFEHRNDPGMRGSEVRVDASPRLETTISVRFAPAELEALRSAAGANGVKLTAFIREAALAALRQSAGAPDPRAQAKAQRLLDKMASGHRVLDAQLREFAAILDMSTVLAVVGDSTSGDPPSRAVSRKPTARSPKKPVSTEQPAEPR